MKDHVPALSVALSVRDGLPWLAPAIESVLAQTFTDFEFLILDDGSRDDTAAVVRGYAARDPRIVLISRENRGLVASLNELFDRARAPLVARMDADDLCHPERFARQVAFLRNHPDCGVVGCAEDFIDSQGRVSGAPTMPPCDHGAIIAAFEAGEVPLSHPSVMVRRGLVRQAGGYRAAYRHCEDLDLWLRLSGITRLANLPDVLLSYRRHDKQVSRRHAFAQIYGAQVARLAWDARRSGRGDPMDGRDALPPIAVLDDVFGMSGTSRIVRERLVMGLLHSAAIADDAGFAEALTHLEQGGRPRPMWRVLPRLVAWGHPVRAARLGLALAVAVRGRARLLRESLLAAAALIGAPLALALIAAD